MPQYGALRGTNEEPPQRKYPKAVFFIIGNEFCERFSYYGMRTVLTLFLTTVLGYGGDSATTIFHTFVMLCYFSPVLGAIISDSWLGKFKTIFYISILYVIGNIVIAIGSLPNSLKIMNILSIVGLLLIAFGTGGIKPCVAAFGGDQFEPGQEIYLQQFFSFFYLSINLGSMISTFLTPILRQDVQCFGALTCFPLAFGIPAILMIIALVIFLVGKPLYKMNPPEGNVLVKAVKCICHGITQKIKAKERNKEHWLDYAEDSYDKKFIGEVRTVLHVLLLYLPLPVFWALFDQQGSRWTLQATKMNGRMTEHFTIKPDQVQVINPLLIIAFIPLFDYVVYPMFRKIHFLERPLQRITVGGLLAAVAFIIAGFLEMKLEAVAPVLPQPGQSETTIINNSPCGIEINDISKTINAFQEIQIHNLTFGKEYSWTFVPKDCNESSKEVVQNFASSYQIETIMVTIYNGELKFTMVEDSREKSDLGYAKVRLLYDLQKNVTGPFLLVGREETYKVSDFTFSGPFMGSTDYRDVIPDVYDVYLSSNDTKNGTAVGKIDVQPGGNYIACLHQDAENLTAVNLNLYVTTEPNTINILYQVPQYVIITAGEIMFSITGLEFSYSQAPASMKAVLQAAWLLTVAFGNVIVVAVTKSKLIQRQSSEFFMFAGLMGLDMLIFAIMAIFYKYVTPPSDEIECQENNETDPLSNNTAENGKPNLAYVDDDTKF